MNRHHVRNVKTRPFEISQSPTAGKLALTAPNARKDARQHHPTPSHNIQRRHTTSNAGTQHPTQAHNIQRRHTTSNAGTQHPTQAHTRPTQHHNRFTSSHALRRRVPMPTCIRKVSQHLRQRRLLVQFRRSIFQATDSKTQQPFLRRRQGRTSAGPDGPHL